MLAIFGELSLDKFRLVTFVWDPSLGTVALELSFFYFRFGTCASDLLLETLAWGFPFFATFAGELSLENNRLGTFTWKVWLGIFA